MTISPVILVLLVLAPILGAFAGVLLGAWIGYSARVGKSPLPSMPARALKQPQAEQVRQQLQREVPDMRP